MQPTSDIECHNFNFCGAYAYILKNGEPAPFCGACWKKISNGYCGYPTCSSEVRENNWYCSPCFKKLRAENNLPNKPQYTDPIVTYPPVKIIQKKSPNPTTLPRIEEFPPLSTHTSEKSASASATVHPPKIKKTSPTKKEKFLIREIPKIEEYNEIETYEKKEKYEITEKELDEQNEIERLIAKKMEERKHIEKISPTHEPETKNTDKLSLLREFMNKYNYTFREMKIYLEILSLNITNEDLKVLEKFKSFQNNDLNIIMNKTT